MVEARNPFAGVTGSGARSIKFTHKDQFGQNLIKPIGTRYDGVVSETPTEIPVTDYKTKLPKHYPSGDPIMQLVITLSGVLENGQPFREDAEDDGTRKLYVKLPIQKALAAEMQAKKIKDFGVGTHLSVWSTGIEEAKPGDEPGTPRQTYEVQLNNIQPLVQPFSQALPAGEQWAQQAPGGYQPPVQQAPVQQQFVAPAAPAFPGQVVPAAAPQAAPQAPAQAFTPPPAPAGIDFAALQQQAAPAAPAGIPVTPELLAQVQQAQQQSGLPVAQVINGMATFQQQQTGISDPTLESRLTEAVGNGQF